MLTASIDSYGKGYILTPRRRINPNSWTQGTKRAWLIMLHAPAPNLIKIAPAGLQGKYVKYSMICHCYIFSIISTRQTEENLHTGMQNSSLLFIPTMSYVLMYWPMSDVTWPQKGLWLPGSTVSYPSDSLASCVNFLLRFTLGRD